MVGFAINWINGSEEEQNRGRLFFKLRKSWLFSLQHLAKLQNNFNHKALRSPRSKVAPNVPTTLGYEKNFN